MKTFKKLMVVFACMAMILNFANVDDSTNEGIQTMSMVHWVTEVQ